MTRLLPLLAVLVALPARAQTACPDCPPLLLDVAGDDEPSRQALAAYVAAYRAEALDSTADLLRALALRDTVVARLGPRVEGWFFAGEEQRYEQMEAFYAEAEALALVPVQAEGMLFDLERGPLIDGLATVLTPPDLMLYLDFVEAQGAGAGGEYPFGWLDAEIGMVLAGEALRREFPSSPYVAMTQEAYGDALLTLASLHPVVVDGFDEPTWFAGVATSEFYPWASDNEALGTFVREAEVAGSRYHAPFAALLASPPEAVPETALEVVVLGDAWASREDAAARALAMLDAGQDVAGPILIGEGWHVAYRYFPAGDPRTEAARERAEAEGLAPRVVTYSPEVY